MKPVLYEPKATDFENDGGLCTLSDCRSLKVTEEANGSYIVELTFPITTKYAEYLEDVNYQIKCKPNDLDSYHVFYIYTHYKDMATGLLYVTAKSRTMKLGNRTVKNVVIDSKSGIEAMALLHDGMDLESDIEMFSDITTVSSTSFEVANPLECVKGIDGSLNQRYGGEIKHEPHRISLLKRRGKDSVTTIRYRKNLEGLKLEFNWDGLITRIFPYADLQNEEGETERVYGTKVDSKFIGNYDGEVYARHIQFTEEQGVSDVKSLNTVASKYFTSMNPGVDKPKVSAEVNIRKLENHAKFKNFRQLGIFDTFTVYHERYNINLELTVNKIVYDGLLEQVESIEAGDPKFTFFEEQQNQFAEVMKKVPTKNYNSSFIDYVTKIISGNDGGNVIWWPKNRPTDLFFVDGETLEDSKKVLRINKSGIGFSSNGWKGPFKTAWTLDGVFIADFIKGGTLEGVKIRSVDDKFIVEMYNGKVRFLRNLGNGKEEEMVAFTPSLNNETGELNGIGLVQNPGYKFAISSKNSDGTFSNVVRVPADSTGSKPKLELFGDVTVTGRLVLNGEEVVAGGGSGGGEGEFPPEIVTDQEKNAWIVWQFLKSKGYTEQAAAGILGNMDQESGVMPDTDQVGGPAYGLVQWDGSAYPLVPPATWNGREYVQNLLRAAGISGDYRIAKTQSQLLEWCMFNGQYIPTSSYPYSVAQFKGLTNISTATTAFEANFERPAATHPERVQLAIKWYNKLHGLKPPTPSGNLKEQLDKFYNTYKERYVQNGQCVGLTTAWMATLTANKYGMTPWNSQAYNPDGSPTSGNPRWNYEINIGDGISAATIGTFAPPPGWTKIIPQSAEDCKAGDIFYVGTDSGISTGHTGIVFEDGKNGRVPTLDQNFLNSPVRWFDGGPSSSWGLYNWFCIWRKNT
ncbi:phage tail tip lysozyme [Lactococcus formosensis]|uniref:Phage tail tip lysozyme n=1 Tax=Lactococcus formosensis TaxID=1281486 RepID=A0A9X4NZQ5_9LACT|nr:phage tail spike protein [Lactococcus formosensis]MDG6145881.1 phage tail tip lysozyme [Lactococcus formosensis]MDG6176362.1 phage tail tip lysozyme [Lactococcus formosensis]